MLKGKTTFTFQMQLRRAPELPRPTAPRAVRRLWWEGPDLCTEFADGTVERYTNAVVQSCSSDGLGEALALVAEPVTFVERGR
jgi:hypothetical protein